MSQMGHLSANEVFGKPASFFPDCYKYNILMENSGMSNCIKCGKTLEEFDVGGDMICMSCEAAGSAHGTGTDVPCQRCGMYLPSTELKMWNSRLFCNYCIMDIQDEERRMQGERRHIERAPATPPEQSFRGSGACERCGKQTDSLYSFSGKKLCMTCYSDASSSGAPPSDKPSMFGQIIRGAAGALGMRKQPKLITREEQGAREIVFDLRRRQMVDRRVGVEAASPLGEGKQGEKKGKPSEKSKKSFFGLFGGKND